MEGRRNRQVGSKHYAADTKDWRHAALEAHPPHIRHTAWRMAAWRHVRHVSWRIGEREWLDKLRAGSFAAVRSKRHV